MRRPLLAAALGLTLAAGVSFADVISGTVWEGIPNAGNAADPTNMGPGLASANFTSSAIDYCVAGVGLTCSNSTYTVAAFLNNPTFTSPVNGFNPTAAGSADNMEVQLTGTIFLTAGANPFNITHDDGLTLSVSGIGLVLNAPGPTSPVTTQFTITAPSTGTYTFTLDYAECCGVPAALEWTYPSGAPVGTVPEPSSIAMAGISLAGMLVAVRRRKA